MDINIGKILIQPKDNWNATTPYEYLNLVRYNKNLYICKSVTGAPVGTLPTNTSYYMHITADGIDAQEIQLQKTATEIQWKRTGDTAWTTLVALSAIKGDTGLKGNTGLKGDKGDPAPNTVWQFSADGTNWSTTPPDGTIYMRESSDGGVTWSDVIEMPTVAAKTAAEVAKTGAETAKSGAETARTGAERAEGAAEAARDAASVSEANAQRTYFNVAQLALQLGNPLLALENQNTLAEAILQENLLINNIYDRLEGGIYAAI